VLSPVCVTEYRMFSLSPSVYITMQWSCGLLCSLAFPHFLCPFLPITVTIQFLPPTHPPFAGDIYWGAHSRAPSHLQQWTHLPLHPGQGLESSHECHLSLSQHTEHAQYMHQKGTIHIVWFDLKPIRSRSTSHASVLCKSFIL